jgi:putative transposase
MGHEARAKRVHQRWAEFRFSVIGHLLAAPPAKGELAGAIAELAEHTWRHPTTSEPTRFGFSTIERWYYRALKEKRDPVGVLRRKLRADAGQQPAMTAAVRQVTLAQYAAHKSWIRDAVVSPARQKLLRYLTYPLQRRKASPLCQFLP